MNIISDLYYFLKGKYTQKHTGEIGTTSMKKSEYRYGFLVHARGYKDIYRKYPSLRYIPRPVVVFLMNNLWPITLSHVTGLYSANGNGSKKEIPGYVFGITMTAEEMMRNRPKALQKIRQALYLARGRGIDIIGLGGLTSSLSGGGRELLDIPINITTGHAYTAFNIVQNVFKMTEIIGVPKNRLKIGIVGAAGSVGSLCALLIARAGYTHITLIDLKRKHDVFVGLEKEMHGLCDHELHTTQDKQTEITISDSIVDIAQCDIIITATNTPEALVTTEVVRAGHIIIDDAQPSDIHPDVLKMPDVLVLEAGVVHTPGIRSNFNYGLKSRTDNFCCMAELLILASHEWKEHYVIHRATLNHVDEISAMGKALGFEIGAFQNFLESLSPVKIEHVADLVRQKYGLSS